jgi:hypothetical protein
VLAIGAGERVEYVVDAQAEGFKALRQHRTADFQLRVFFLQGGGEFAERMLVLLMQGGAYNNNCASRSVAIPNSSKIYCQVPTLLRVF